MLNRIRALRKAQGLTMKQLGSAIGVAESTISQYETGKRQPDNETLLQLGEFFGVTVGYILGAEEEKAPTPEGERTAELSPAFFRLKQGLEPYDISESDADFLLDVYKAHIKKNQQE